MFQLKELTMLLYGEIIVLLNMLTLIIQLYNYNLMLINRNLIIFTFSLRGALADDEWI